MACLSCGIDSDQADVRHSCRVCELVDGDKTIKRVQRCRICGAYLCFKCLEPTPENAVRRSKAFVKDKVEFIKGAIIQIKDYFK